jgi:hypothetical protein
MSTNNTRKPAQFVDTDRRPATFYGTDTEPLPDPARSSDLHRGDAKLLQALRKRGEELKARGAHILQRGEQVKNFSELELWMHRRQCKADLPVKGGKG